LGIDLNIDTGDRNGALWRILVGAQGRMEDAASSAGNADPGAGVDVEMAAKALASVTPLGKEMARALMWLVDECISCAVIARRRPPLPVV
jgi:hypothetical protein